MGANMDGSSSTGRNGVKLESEGSRSKLSNDPDSKHPMCPNEHIDGSLTLFDSFDRHKVGCGDSALDSGHAPTTSGCSGASGTSGGDGDGVESSMGE